MTENIRSSSDVGAQNLAQSYAAMRVATVYEGYDPLELKLRNKRSAIMREAADNFSGLFALEGDSRVVEQQRFGIRNRLAALYAELEENIDPVPAFNGYFTKGYQKAAIALAQKLEATTEQKAEANILQAQNEYIAECHKPESQQNKSIVDGYFSKKPEPLPPEEAFVSANSLYLQDIKKREQRSRVRAQSSADQKEGFFTRTRKKMGSAWKTFKGWFTR